MSEWHDLAHFLYGRGFWYAHPVDEIDGLTEEELLWVPDPKVLCALWHVGHIAHRERTHIGRFLEGLKGEIIPPRYEVFGPEWASVEQVGESAGPLQGVLDWVCEVRDKSHEYIDSLTDEQFHTVLPTSEGGLSIAHWLFITVAHGALHIGRIQTLRALIEGAKERAC